jgi:ligand-binding sensor domain-containing protein
LPMPESLPSADIYGLALYRGDLWVSTFNQGLLCYRTGHWRTVSVADGLAGPSPRQMVVFQDRLYVRQTTSQLDCYDGKVWGPAFAKGVLPRPDTYTLATDGTRLYLGGWAGWAATDGKTWTFSYHDAPLDGQVVTSIAAAGGTVWVGTEQRGLVACAGGKTTQYHEASGLTDDWITCIDLRPERLLVGTYCGGLLKREGKRFTQLLTAEGFAIRVIVHDPRDGRALAATPLGVYRETAKGWVLLPTRLTGGVEAQALCPTPDGLWVGTRSALAFVPWRDVDKGTSNEQPERQAGERYADIERPLTSLSFYTSTNCCLYVQLGVSTPESPHTIGVG